MLQQRTLQHTRRIHHHQNKCNLHIFKKNCKIRMLDLAGNFFGGNFFGEIFLFSFAIKVTE